MLNPYHVIGQALALFKAAGLPVPAYGEEEKRRLLDAWVQRYGSLDADIFVVCSKKLTSGQKFPRFYDMDEAVREAVREALRIRKRKEEADAAAPELPPVDHEKNKQRIHQLVEHLVKRC